MLHCSFSFSVYITVFMEMEEKNSNNLPHHQKVLCESIISFFKQKNPMSVNICFTSLDKVRKEG